MESFQTFVAQNSVLDK